MPAGLLPDPGRTALFTQKKELLRAGDCGDCPASKLLEDAALWLVVDFEALAP